MAKAILPILISILSLTARAEDVTGFNCSSNNCTEAPAIFGVIGALGVLWLGPHWLMHEEVSANPGLFEAGAGPWSAKHVRGDLRSGQPAGYEIWTTASAEAPNDVDPGVVRYRGGVQWMLRDDMNLRHGPVTALSIDGIPRLHEINPGAALGYGAGLQVGGQSSVFFEGLVSFSRMPVYEVAARWRFAGLETKGGVFVLGVSHTDDRIGRTSATFFNLGFGF